MTDDRGQTRPLLVTIKEAANILAVSERTLYRLVKQGKLAVVKITADTPRIRYDELEALVASSVAVHEPEATDQKTEKIEVTSGDLP